jgi:hypothetical protein
MTATFNSNREIRREPSDGRFAKHDRAEAEVSLHGQGYPIINTPTQDQNRRAQEARARASAWATATGEDDHRTVDDYARDLADQEASYEAYKVGAIHPDDSAFDEIWSGDSPGASYQYISQLLDVATENRATLLLGDVPNNLSAELNSSKSPHKDATRIVEMRIELYTEAMRSSGKNLSVNQSAVARSRKVAERAEAPF